MSKKSEVPKTIISAEGYIDVKEKTYKSTSKINSKDSLTQYVEFLAKKDPEKYACAQKKGEELMNMNYDLKFGQDESGDMIKCNILINTFNECRMSISELTIDERNLLNRTFGDVDWRQYFNE